MRETERRQIDPGLVAQQYECDEDHGEAKRRNRRARRAPIAVGPLFAARVMIAAAARKLTSTMPSAIAALAAPSHRGSRPATSDDDRRDHEAALDDVERDLALDERDYGFFAATASPPRRAAIWAMYV